MGGSALCVTPVEGGIPSCPSPLSACSTAWFIERSHFAWEAGHNCLTNYTFLKSSLSFWVKLGLPFQLETRPAEWSSLQVKSLLNHICTKQHKSTLYKTTYTHILQLNNAKCTWLAHSQARVLLRNRLHPQSSQWEDVMSGKLGGIKKRNVTKARKISRK